MRCLPLVIILLLAGLACAAAELAERAEDLAASARGAVQRAIPLLEKAAMGSSTRRECFTCHHQAMPVVALAEARRRGFTIDEGVFQSQVDHTVAHLDRGRTRYLENRGQGGGALTAGYALWTLAAAGQAPTATTRAVTSYLLGEVASAGHWHKPGPRPPSEGSDFTVTYVAFRGLLDFGTSEQRAAIAEQGEKVRRWLEVREPEETEDHVFRLLLMPYLGMEDAAHEAAVSALLAAQREDGGWAQMPSMESDAYATASALVALREGGGVAPDHEAFRRGVRYLLDGQSEDGSWHVVTRADGFQEFFESGFPHGEDQFISMAASCWAAWALLLALPEPPEPGAQPPAP